MRKIDAALDNCLHGIAGGTVGDKAFVNLQLRERDPGQLLETRETGTVIVNRKTKSPHPQTHKTLS